MLVQLMMATSMLASNGVCLTGLWEITEETEYSGYFRKGSRSLVMDAIPAELPRSFAANCERWRWSVAFSPPLSFRAVTVAIRPLLKVARAL
jgi:hypothetical protein